MATASASGESRLAHLTDLARQVTARHDLNDVLNATFAGLRRTLVFGGGSIQLLNDEGWIRLAAADPAPTQEAMAMRIPLGASIGGRIILTERAVYIPDVLADTDVTEAEAEQGPLRARVSPGGIRSYFGVPLIADGRAIGLLQVDAPEVDAWDLTDRLLLLSLAPIVAAAIQNARAYARVAILTASRRRELERHALIASVVDSDVDVALAALVALSEDIPLVRDQVDRLTVAIGRIRGALGDRLTSDEHAPITRPRRRTGDGVGDIDLRASNKTRT